MRLYDVRVAHWIDERVLHHRSWLLCRHLWCWHALCHGEIPAQCCGYCGRGARP
jgi:hypothetical protein